MNKLAKSTKTFLSRNSPLILSCIGGVGVVLTTVIAVKATPKAILLLEEAKEEKGEELNALEKIKTAGPIYIPAIVTGASTIACIFGANVLNQKQQTSLMSAYALTNASYKAYKKKVEELYGKEADDNIVKAIAKDNLKDNDILVEEDKELFYDSFSNRYFESTMANVIRAEYDLNKTLSTTRYACVNEFYDFLGIAGIEGGDRLAWSEETMYESTWSSWIDFRHEKVVMDDGLECTIIYLSTEPSIEY